MQTIGNFLQAKFNRFYFFMESDELNAFLMPSGLDVEQELTNENLKDVKEIILKAIPEMLLMPESVQEGDMSIKRNITGLKAYYSILAGELGKPDIFAPEKKNPTLRSRSNLW